MEIRPEMLDLARAFNEARLAALHIDMQLEFNENRCREGRVPTERVFPIVKKFAADLRELNVTNHWIAFTGSWHKGSYENYLSANNMARGLRLFPSMGIEKDDMVFQKAKQHAFEGDNGVLATYLRQEGTDTLIIDGVKDKHCVTDTIATGLKLKDNLRFYVALDATNCPALEFEDFADWFNRGSTAEEKQRVIFTSTGEITKTIRMAQKPEFQKLIAA